VVWARLPIQPGPRPGQVSEQKIQIGALTRVKPIAVTAAPNGADPRARLRDSSFMNMRRGLRINVRICR